MAGLRPGMRTGVRGAGVAVLAGVLFFASLEMGEALQRAAAGATAQAVQVAPADSVPLVFEREVFNYPGYERRNPFRPLTGEDVGPRFEDLILTGVIVAMDRTRSVATIGERPPGSQGNPTRTHRLREGDVIGNSRILEIRDQWVTVQVEEFGLFELRTLDLRRAAPTPIPQAAPPGAGIPAPPAAGETLDTVPPASSEQGMRGDSPNGNGGWS